MTYKSTHEHGNRHEKENELFPCKFFASVLLVHPYFSCYSYNNFDVVKGYIIHTSGVHVFFSLNVFLCKSSPKEGAVFHRELFHTDLYFSV